MDKKCRHRKGLILASAKHVEFTPDQEPFESGVIESSGYESIVLEVINIHWCPKCKVVRAIYTDGFAEGETEK